MTLEVSVRKKIRKYIHSLCRRISGALHYKMIMAASFYITMEPIINPAGIKLGPESVGMTW